MQIARTSFGNLSREMLSVKFQRRLSLEEVRKRKAASRRALRLLREYPRNLGIAGGFLADRKSGLSQDDHRDGTRSRFLQQLKRVAEEYRLI